MRLRLHLECGHVMFYVGCAHGVINTIHCDECDKVVKVEKQVPINNADIARRVKKRDDATRRTA